MASIFVRRHGWELRSNDWDRTGSSQSTIVFDYTVYIGSTPIRMWSTKGKIGSGHYDSRAAPLAERLAKELGQVLNAPVIHVRTGACQRTW